MIDMGWVSNDMESGWCHAGPYRAMRGHSVMYSLQCRQNLSLEVENLAKKSDKTAVESQRPNDQSSDREDIDEKDVAREKKETQVPIEDVSELETFWRSYIAWSSTIQTG